MVLGRLETPETHDAPPPPPKTTPPRSRRHRVARRTISVLPTLFTLGNLLAGFGAIFAASRPAQTDLPFGWSPITFAALLVFLGMILDALDGRIARLTRSFSDLGEQLDSMADMVSFGVAPAFIVIQVVQVQAPFLAENPRLDTFFDRLGLMVAAAFVACAGLRLARFNVELNAEPNDAESELQKHLAFSGLPSPGAAGTVASLAVLHQHFLHTPGGLANTANEAAGAADYAAVGIVGATLLCALAMVSRLRYLHLLNRYVRGRAPFETVAVMVVLGLVLAVYPQVVVAAGFVAYALSAPAAAALRKLGLLPDITDLPDGAEAP